MGDVDRVRSDFIRRHIERAQLLVTAARAEFDRSHSQQWWAEAVRIVTAFQPYFEWHRASVPVNERADIEGKIKRLEEHLSLQGGPV